MLLIPVHDELVFEVPANDIDEVLLIVKDTMTRAAAKALREEIPIEVETTIGENWGKA